MSPTAPPSYVGPVERWILGKSILLLVPLYKDTFYFGYAIAGCTPIAYDA